MYIYIYIFNNSPYGKKKKPQKTASDLKMTMYNESLSKGKNIYWKKRKGQPCHTNWKQSKDTQLVGQKKKKNTVQAAKLQCKKCSILSREI